MKITCILHGKQPPPNYFGEPNCIKRESKMFLLTPTSYYTEDKRKVEDCETCTLI